MRGVRNTERIALGKMQESMEIKRRNKEWLFQIGDKDQEYLMDFNNELNKFDFEISRGDSIY